MLGNRLTNQSFPRETTQKHVPLTYNQKSLPKHSHSSLETQKITKIESQNNLYMLVDNEETSSGAYACPDEGWWEGGHGTEGLFWWVEEGGRGGEEGEGEG